MTEQKNYTGYWFLPNNTEHKVAGSLVYLPGDKIQLELLGVLDTRPDYIIDLALGDDNKQTDIIQGITSCGKEISLIHCRAFGSLSSGALTPILKYKCQFLLEGYLLSNIKSKSFDSIKIDLPALKKWHPASCIRQTIRFDELGKVAQEYQITLAKKNYTEEIIYLDRNYKINLHSSSGFSQKDEYNSEISISQKTFCHIDHYSSKTDFLDLLGKANQFKLFLNLATLSSNAFSSLILTNKDHYQDLGNRDKWIKPIQLYYVDQNENIDSQTYNYLFKYHQIEDIYPQIIRAWYNLGEKHAPIRNHLLESIKRKRVWKSTDFLIVAQALEGYHRRFINNNSKLSLRDRLEEICLKFSDIKYLNILSKDITHTVKSRNYYSHFHEEKNDVLDGIELYELAEKLRILLICCFLSILGFSNSKISTLIRESNNHMLN